MQEKEKIDSILFYNDEDEDIRPTEFYVPTTYSDKVKIHNWQMRTLSEPRDNVDIFPPHGNLHRSSYRRFGSENGSTGISETRTMLSQIELKDEYKPIAYPRRNFLAMQSLASAKKDYEEEEELKLTDVLMDRAAICRTDYCTTTSDDYRSPYPLKPKPPVSPPPIEPWLLNRFAIGYSPEDLENRRGYRTFLDDDMDLHRRVAELKMKRGKLHALFIKDEQR